MDTTAQTVSIRVPAAYWEKYGKTNVHPQKELVRALYKLIEIKDMKTANHCKAVAHYAKCLGADLGLSSDELDLIHHAGMVHDIGKIMVDNVTLYQTDVLSPNEIHQLNEHTRKGMQILETFHLADSIVDAAWHHHERWDGKGYPDGFKGNSIRFMTQIISVADSLDAMSTNRVYRKALSFDEIIEELKKASDTQLNAEICQVAIRMLENDELHRLG